MRLAFGLVAAAFLLTTPVAAQTVAVTGVDGTTVTIGAANLAALPRQSLSLTGRGQPHAYEGAALPAEDGPFRLVEDDSRPARSARQVTAITVRTAD